MRGRAGWLRCARCPVPFPPPICCILVCSLPCAWVCLDAASHTDCGSSTNSCHEDFRGPAAFSEAESRAVRDFLSARAAGSSLPSSTSGSVGGSGGDRAPVVNFAVALNYHSFAKKVFLPYSCVKMISSEPEEHKRTLLPESE